MNSSRMRTVRNSSNLLGGWPSVMVFCYGLLVWLSGLVAFWFGAFWFGDLLVWWPSGVAFCYGLLVERGLC